MSGNRYIAPEDKWRWRMGPDELREEYALIRRHGYMTGECMGFIEALLERLGKAEHTLRDLSEHTSCAATPELTAEKFRTAARRSLPWTGSDRT